MNSAWTRRTIEITLAVCGVLGVWFYGLRVVDDGLRLIKRPILANADLIPAWYGARAVLEHSDPYAPEVTTRIQLALYGYKATETMDQQGFANPAFSVFLFLPFALLPFATAAKLAFVVFAALTAFSIRCWTGVITAYHWLLGSLLVAASFPFYYALHGRQPTLLIAGILAAAFAAVRSGRLMLGGVLLALAVAKPQLALPVLLPVFGWSLGSLQKRRILVISFAVSLLILILASEFLSPGWVSNWFGALRAYTHYVAAVPLLQESAGAAIGALLSGAVIGIVLLSIWIFHDDLGFTVALSIAAFLLVIPFHIYDEILLLGPICWLVMHRWKFVGWASRLLLVAVFVSLAEGWLASSAIALLYLMNRSAALAVWAFPLGLAGMLPYALFLALSHQAITRWFKPAQPVPVRVSEASRIYN